MFPKIENSTLILKIFITTLFYLSCIIFINFKSCFDADRKAVYPVIQKNRKKYHFTPSKTEAEKANL
jgi:hypothetical protein